jgi:spermine/spermidine synthase
VSPDNPRTTPAVLGGVSCLSAAILIVELALTRIFSVTMFYHFAFLAVSIAMFGLSGGSLFVYVTPSWHRADRTLALLRRYGALCAIATTAAAILLLRIRVDVGNGLRLGAVFGIAALPFLSGGAGMAIAVSRLYRDIGRVYAADLIGAACGCLLLIPALNVLGGPGTLLLAAVLAAASAVLFTQTAPARDRAIWSLPFALLLIGTGAQMYRPWLDVRAVKGRENDRPIFSRWNSFSRVAVYDSEHPDWGLSPTFTGARPLSLYMDIDASASTPILQGGPLDGALSYLQYEITGLAYALGRHGHALIIGPGGGRDIWTALLAGMKRVDAVEVNPIIVDEVMGQHFRAFAGDVYHAPGVTVHVDDGRSYVARSQERYDLIQASLVDTWAATSAGAFALTENNLYTVEAFEAYLRHLAPDGVLTITRWYATGLRLVSLLHGAAARLGWPGLTNHVFVARNGAVATLVVKNSDLTDEDVRRLVAACERLKFAVIYSPSTMSDPTMSDTNDYAQLITSKDTEAFYRLYPWDITPSTDDRPFFFQNIRVRDELRASPDGALAGSAGFYALRTLVILSFALVVIFIVTPLAGFSPDPIGPLARALGPILYLACLGVGFMLIEIGLTQRFVLFLGHPVYALTVILFTLLLGGGIGSALSQRVGGTPRATIAVAIPLVIVASLVYAAALPTLFTTWIGLSRTARVALSIALLLPLGIVLGMPLPAGVGFVRATRPALLAWAWGVNGAASIFGAAAAILLAINWGFTRVATMGAVVYAAALVIGLLMAGTATVSEPAVSG